MITPLNLHYSFTNPASIHDEESLTALELAGRQGAKINEVVRDQNSLRTTTESTLKEQTETVIPETVDKVVDKYIEDGAFDDQIEEHIGNLEERLENFLENLPEGSTTMDAEIIDIRVSNDGHTFQNAGQSVRHDFHAVSSKGISEVSALGLNFERQSWEGSPANNRLSVLPVVVMSEPVKLRVPEDYKISRQVYNDAGDMLSDTSWQNEVTLPAGQKVGVSFKRTDDGIVTPIDLCAIITEKCKWNDTHLASVGYYFLNDVNGEHSLVYDNTHTRMAVKTPFTCEKDLWVKAPEQTTLSIAIWEDGKVTCSHNANTNTIVIPRNTSTTLHLKDKDGGEMTLEHFKELTFRELNAPGEFWETFESRDYVANYHSNRLASLYQTYEKPFDLKAHNGFQIAVIRYGGTEGDYKLENNSGWVTSFTVPRDKFVTICVRKSDDTQITVEDLTNIEVVTPVWKESTFNVAQGDTTLADILDTTHHANWGGNSVGYVEGYNRMVSDFLTLDAPLTVESIHPDVYISSQTFNDENKSTSDTGWQKEVTLPAGTKCTLYIKREGETYMTLSTLSYIKCKQVADVMVTGGTYSNIKAIAHRGLSMYAPENTIPAYQMAVDNGYQYAECDVSFTKDGVAVLLHDGTIDRTSTGSGNIGDLTLEQLRQYDFGSWFSDAFTGTSIPTFEEFIVFCRNKGLHPYIELKAGATELEVKSVVDCVIRNGMKRKITYISFDYNLVSYAHQYDPTARIGWVVNSCDETIAGQINALRGENDVVCFINQASVNDDTINACITADLEMECWTVNTTDRMKELDSYVTGVASDGLHFAGIMGGN